MASKAMWEVDPETRAKLAAIQKEAKNNICCDCNAPSPQWASPKFGVFICLSCAGVHRGLGVHISFVRSISMDAFKQVEIERMRLGGNENWRTFFEEHEDTKMRGISWDDATIAERYSGEVGDEWKERLAAKVEGREYEPGEKKPTPAAAPTSSNRSSTPLSGNAQSRTASPGRKAKVDDVYFSKLGAENAARSDNLPPSQGGKYAGFGNTPTSQPKNDTAPSWDELQKDPMAGLTKGFGWFTSAVTKTAKTVNDGYIQPTAKQLATSDFAKQAQQAAGQVGRVAQQGARNAQDGFTKFVEGPREGSGYRQAPMDESRKGFWDDFSDLADQRDKPAGSGAIGTAAMGKGKTGGAAPPAGKKDEWDDW
ncbi:ADP-ribosylation factor GTPase-activating protein GCS1 [Plectosphaerella plurivora]|uniref:ADP-ribosylation factor GTPase-activating protein GCS1 n=1 Tax=Plectosphaerella plurivora TaxID=936078 RepID=A0A9P9ABL0_9PEZI|nr:ADP-ribosylation factor GTPase-activating protein GCS1 [Plectosphaerella plurivora]